MNLGFSALSLVGRRAGGVVPYTGLVSTHCRARDTLTTGNKQIMARKRHVAGTNISRTILVFGNFRLLNNQSAEATGGGSLTLTASIEYPAGTFKQVTFNGGSTSVVIPDGGLAFSDWTTGDLGIPEGADYWTRSFETYETGIIYNNFRNTAAGDLLTAAASGLTDQTMGGTITSSGNFSAGPIAILGTMNKPSVVLIDDSKGAGFADTAESATAAGPGLRGEIARGFPASLPFVNLSTGGGRANLWGSEYTSRKLLLPYFSHYVLGLARNDLYVTSDSAATVKASVEAIIADILAANPRAKITCKTITPTSTSTDGWATTGNQTTSPRNGERVIHNTTVRTGGIVGNNNGYFEIADWLETSRGSGIWTAPPTVTGDGVHQNPTGYAVPTANGAIDWSVKFASI